MSGPRLPISMTFLANAFLALALALAAVLMATPAWAGGNVSITRSFQPSSADSRVKQPSPTSTAGTDNYTEINPEAGAVDRGLVQFDISSIPSGSSVSSATLSLWLAYNTDTESRTHNVHRLTESWTEAGVTWNSRNGTNNWSTAGGTFNSTATDSQTVSPAQDEVFIPWTVSTDVSDFVAGTASNYGWIVKDSEAVSTTAKWQYRTKEYGTASQHPKLAVTFTAPWDSYQESDRTNVRDTFNSSYTTVYMKGTGFASASYLVAYYDANGDKRGSETIAVTDGTLNSAYVTTSDTGAAAGTWHALVQPSSGYTAFGTDSYATITAAPDTYGLLANDSFTVEASAIPEFSTVIGALGVAGMSFGIYWWLRKRVHRVC